MSRRPILAGNWKMNLLRSEATAICQGDELYDPAESKIYRHPTFYDVPDDVEFL